MRSGCGFISASSPADGIDGTGASGPLAQPRHVHATVRAGPAPGPSVGPPRFPRPARPRWPSGTPRGAASTTAPAARGPRGGGLSSAGQGLVQIGADRVLQLAKRVHVGTAAAPLPVQPVDSLRAPTEEVPGCRVVDVGIDQLRPAATLPDAVPEPALLDEPPAPRAPRGRSAAPRCRRPRAAGAGGRRPGGGGAGARGGGGGGGGGGTGR